MMRQPYTVSIAMRYLRPRGHAAFISFISSVSMLGIALAVAVLILVMAIVNGFESELERRILSVAPDAWLTGYADGAATPVASWMALRDAALARDDIEAAAPFVEGQGMLVVGGEMVGVAVRGVDPALETAVSSLHEHVAAGSWSTLADGDSIVIGSALAEALGVGVGDRAILLLPEAQNTPAGIMPRLKAFDVGAIFDVGLAEFDRGLVLVGFAIATRLYRTDGRANGISLDVVDRYAAGAIVNEFGQSIVGEYDPSYLPEDWTYRHANIFRSIELTRPLLFIMLSLVMAIAAFNIVSTLFMVVREKRGDIAILRTLGSAPRSILNIFVVQGASIGVLGVLGGLALGLALVASFGTIVGLVEAWLEIDLLAAEVYVIGDITAEAHAGETAQICLMAFALAVMATLYPAWRASRLPPAEALRNE